MVFERLLRKQNSIQKGFVTRQFFLLFEHSTNLGFNPLSANPTKSSNTLKQFVGKLPTNCLSVLDHFVKLALKGLTVFALRCNHEEPGHRKMIHVHHVIRFAVFKI